MSLEINELKLRISELKEITQRFSIGGTLAAKDVMGLVENILKEVFQRGLPLLEESEQQAIHKTIVKMDNNKVGVEKFTFGHLNNLFDQTQFFEKYAKALQTKTKVVKVIDLKEFVKLRNMLTHQNEQLSKFEAEFLIDCLKFFIATFIREESVANISEETVTQSPIFYVPRAKNEYFTGREEILKQLHVKLQQNQVVALNQKITIAVHGLGGIGKTQTLIEYAYRCRDQSIYQTILWLSADSKESFESGFRTLATDENALNLPVKEKSFEEIKKSVENWFLTHKEWLLLIDNADELEIIRTFLSKVKGQGQILISTRAQNTRPFAEPLGLEKMTELEAVDFLEKRTGLFIDDHAKELAKTLDYLPLALDQAAAYIQGGKSF